MFLFSSPPAGSRSRRTAAALATGATMLFAGLAQAQHDHAMPAARPAASANATVASAPPTAPGASMPLQFESVLSRYKPMTDQKLGSWRDANATVTRIGGWRTYLKESESESKSQPPEAAAPALPATPNTPSVPTTPNPHAGHGAKP